jgi:hypothetical protein
MAFRVVPFLDAQLKKWLFTLFHFWMHAKKKISGERFIAGIARDC